MGADTLLDSGGLICLVEIQGLFSVHTLLKGHHSSAVGVMDDEAPKSLEQLFQQADDNVLRLLQNGVLAGTKLEYIVRGELSDVLEVQDASEWDDGELAFEGAATEECLENWAKRLKRPAISKAVENVKLAPSEGSLSNEKSFAELFLECVKSDHHTTLRKVKMVILRKK